MRGGCERSLTATVTYRRRKCVPIRLAAKASTTLVGNPVIVNVVRPLCIIQSIASCVADSLGRNARTANVAMIYDAGAENWATIASLIETCNLNAVDLLAYMTGTLTFINQPCLARPIGSHLTGRP